MPSDPDLQDIPPDVEYGDMLQEPKSDADEVEFETFDQYVGAEFLANLNDETSMATVTKHVKDNNGNAIGKKNANPLMDTSEYECTLEDGSVYRYIAKQCDRQRHKLSV